MRSDRVRRGLLLSAAMVCLSAASTAPADVLLVPSEYATIQAALDAALAGDVVEIADGTYTGEGNKNLNFLGKAITVRSASGKPANCSIDCERSGRGVYFDAGEGADTRLEGVAILNGGVDYGGGLYIGASAPTIVNCIIKGNEARSQGGGVHCGDSSALLIRCEISMNTSRRGGGFYGGGDPGPTLIDCKISLNEAEDGGG
ncbi:MAG: hypothetical protein ACF8NJ_00700, partial [Phycisphaerales bacterium JB038]